MGRCARLPLLLGVALSGGSAAGRQGTPPPQSQANPPETLRVTTRLVTVSVVVKDAQGKPVTDLGKDDFVVLEESKPQKIELFTLESSRIVSRPEIPLPPNTYTNRRPDGAANSPNVSLILLDSLHLQIQDQSYARDRVIKFLGQVRPEDRVAVYELSRSGVRVVHDFSTDSRSLLAALARYRVAYPSELDPPTGTGLLGPRPHIFDDEFAGKMEDCFARMREEWIMYQTTNRAVTTTSGMRDIANRLARFPGRKNLIWISSGFSFGGKQGGGIDSPPGAYYLTQVERAAEALTAASVVAYPVDAKGMLAAIPAPATAETNKRVGLRSVGRFTAIYDSMSGANTMNVLAGETGGRFFSSRNDIDGAIRNAIEDGQTSYLLGYYPTHGKWNGRFVKIKVKVNRPGVRVQARSGYFASAAQTQEKELLPLLEDTAMSPLDAAAVGLAVRSGSGDATTLKLDIDIDPNSVTLLLEKGSWTGCVYVMLMQQKADGTVISKPVQAFDLRFTADERRQMEQNGLTINYEVRVEASAAKLRVVVCDQRSGAVGAVTVPVSSGGSASP